MAQLELGDIQSGVLRPRPTPFEAAYWLLRIDDRDAGRALMRAFSGIVPSAAGPMSPRGDLWVSVSLTYQGLKALGVPRASLDSFSAPFREGMAARGPALGDTGESAPERWEQPLGTADVHVVVTGIAPDRPRLENALRAAREALQSYPGVVEIWRQECHVLPGEREHFGFRDGIGHPAIEGSGIPGTNPYEAPLKAGDFVLGYEGELQSPVPQPDALGRNGTYVAFRKLHQNVAAFRRFLRENAADAADEERLAAKMMGRWRSGCPLALSPERDDPALGADAARNNAFLYKADDPIGYKTPLGSHVRRTNPRDGDIAGVARIHRMIRRGTAYGPPLPDGTLDDDGEDRGLVFAFVGTDLSRQFEFVQKEWANKSEFFGGSDERDPIIGANRDSHFAIPRRPIRRRLEGIARFVVTRGGEYAFMPSLSALRWLGDLTD